MTQTFYRLEYNTCSAIGIFLSQKTTVDYDTLVECQAQIPSTYYRFSNNTCNSISLSASQKTSNDYATSAECQVNILSKPNVPQPTGFAKFLQAFVVWFKSLFSGTQQTILGQVNIEPNTQQTYNIDISTTSPDSDWGDGTYQIQYANWALTDKDGNVKKEGTWEPVFGRYTKNVTITTPSNIGDYILLGVITQYDMTYDFPNKVWNASEEKVVNKEAINLKNKYVVIAPTTPQPTGFSKLLANIINFFKNLFGIN
jgi:hypothetical protein